jgi:hypothetical protein
MVTSLTVYNLCTINAGPFGEMLLLCLHLLKHVQYFRTSAKILINNNTVTQ